MLLRCAHCQTPIELSGEETAFSQCPVCASSLSNAGTPYDERTCGDRIAHFELTEKLGAGSYGSVWKAQDVDLDRAVAIKLPRVECVDPDRLLREAKAAACVRHPAIIEVFEICLDGDRPYIVTEFVDGSTLEEWLQNNEPSPTEIASLLKQLADALHVAHEAKIVHRDIKPANILIDHRHGVHIADFGIAKREDADATMTIDGQILGTPAYMPPEQARGEKATSQADIYSLGAVLYRTLAGKSPFSGSTHAILARVLSDEQPELEDTVPQELKAICFKAMSKVPADRYDTAGDMAADLQRYLDGEQVTAPVPKRKPSKTSGQLRQVLTFLAVPALIAGAYFLSSHLTAGGVPPTQTQYVLISAAENSAPITRLYAMPVVGLTCEHNDALGPHVDWQGDPTDTIELELKSGTYYLIVAAADNGDFHIVWRWIPDPSRASGDFNHNSWQVVGHRIQLPSIELFPTSKVVGDQTLVKVDGGRAILGEGDARDAQYEAVLPMFHLGKREVQLGEFNLWLRGKGRSEYKGAGPVINAQPDEMIAFAEYAGCRIQTDDEWEFAATNGQGGSRINYTGNVEPGSWHYKPEFLNRTPTDADKSPLGIDFLFTGASEVTCSRSGNRKVLLSPDEDLKGGRSLLIASGGIGWTVRGLRADFLFDPPNAQPSRLVHRSGYTKEVLIPALSFRLARSERPKWDWHTPHKLMLDEDTNSEDASFQRRTPAP